MKGLRPTNIQLACFKNAARAAASAPDSIPLEHGGCGIDGSGVGGTLSLVQRRSAAAFVSSGSSTRISGLSKNSRMEDFRGRTAVS